MAAKEHAGDIRAHIDQEDGVPEALDANGTSGKTRRGDLKAYYRNRAKFIESITDADRASWKALAKVETEKRKSPPSPEELTQ